MSDLARFATGNSATSLLVAAPPGVYYVRVRGRYPQGEGPASNEILVVVF
jgi:hypothetical protein